MSRRFLDDVRTDVNTQLVTNGTGAITASILNPIILDTIDSTIPDECFLSGDATAAIPIGVTYTQLSTAFNNQAGGDGDFLKPDVVNGQVETSTTAGFTYSVSTRVSFYGTTNSDFDFTIFQDGVAIGFAGGETGEGVNDPVTGVASVLVNSAPTNALYSVAVKSSQASTIDIIDILLSVIILPTNNP
jgi:hypothetical protein